jgi:hypothetical protein
MILNGTIAILIKYGYWKSQIVISNSSVYQKQLNRGGCVKTPLF